MPYVPSHEPGEDGDRFLPVEEVVRRAEVAKRGGARILHLIGGEPTMHPELLTIVEELSQMGLRLAVISNGFRLGREPELSQRLRRLGSAGSAFSSILSIRRLFTICKGHTLQRKRKQYRTSLGRD